MNARNNAAIEAVQAKLCPIDAIDAIDAIDSAQAALLKAQALIAMTFGESGKAFRTMNDDYQERFLWAINDLVNEATSRVTAIAERGISG